MGVSESPFTHPRGDAGNSGGASGKRKRSVLVRMLQLWKIHAVMDLLWVTRDAKQFLLYAVSDFILNFGAALGMLMLAERFNGIGHWSKHQILFMLGYAMIVDGILATFFGFNVLYVSRVIGRGQLDHLLIQPQPLWMTLLAQGFVPFESWSMFLPGLGLMAWAAPRLSLHLSAGWFALLGLQLTASSAIVLSYSFLWSSLAFGSPRAAEEISSSALGLVTQLKTFPLDGVGPALLGGLLSLLPIGFLAWYPSRFLLGLDPNPWSGAVTPGVAVLFGIAAAVAFRKGLALYEKTGSQRYLSSGFRR
jgi:ABC-2 type transport system permease protein